jgi:hypothetical protein
MPGSVPTRGNCGRDQQQGRAGCEHVDLEDARQALDDNLKVEGQGHEACTLRQSDDPCRDSKGDQEANRGTEEKARHSFARAG